ncbi:hypothetical protein DYD21_18060 [Rhodohalobacter sp. SW132]|uniref:hypothetical protein n=1 Tax=Rhodohalobacter sp. SW132 TaxID=2293433 RepID=UPI000E262BC7|nr:hypothetical protein [Rhodohalobacter sp. SW132]REL24497.1 hypothetical protein DYD21_18060 [Rhodohalobacter sp. SW132]
MLRHHRRASDPYLTSKGNQRFGWLLILEVAAIVIGVMIGFLVNEWREGRNNRAVAENALTSIAAEMRYNHDRMVENFYYYTYITSQIDSLMQAGEPVREMYGYQLEGWRGAMPPLLRSSAYQMMLSTGIFKDVPFSSANQLAYIYNLQSLIEKMDDASIANFSHDSDFTRLQSIRHIFGLYAELIPSVIGVYQLMGTEIMYEYGYTSTVDPGRLKDEMELQMQGFEMNFER